VHNARMASKTISLKVEAYERLRAARRYPSESFSEVVLRATWPEQTVTGLDLLCRGRRDGSSFSSDGLNQVEFLKVIDTPPQS